jgi:signal transduction histidine kinase
MNQVFMNIISNAIDALEAAQISPQVALKSSHINISTEINSQDQVKIMIADNSPGISASIRQKIFDPFFTTKPVGQGTGLGLAISD